MACQGDELRLIRHGEHSRFLFLSERGAPVSIDGAQKLIERLGRAAGFKFPIHVHMLRHSAGYARSSWVIAPSAIRRLHGHRRQAHPQHLADPLTIAPKWWFSEATSSVIDPS